MINCLNCRAETSNGLALCDLCQEYARACLAYIPVYFRNLSRWRPGRAGSRAVPASREPAGVGGPPRGDRVFRALDESGGDLTTWARMLIDDRPELLAIHPVEAIAGDLGYADEHEMVRLVCVGLSRHLTSIATLDWGGELVKALGRHEARLRNLTEDVVPGWYAGACEGCGFATYVLPGITWVTCGACGKVTYARDHLDVVLVEAHDWVARPKRLAEAIVALVDTEPSVDRMYERIKKWASRGDIPAFRRLDGDGDEVGPRRCRLGDVIERMGQRASSTNERLGA